MAFFFNTAPVGSWVHFLKMDFLASGLRYVKLLCFLLYLRGGAINKLSCWAASQKIGGLDCSSLQNTPTDSSNWIKKKAQAGPLNRNQSISIDTNQIHSFFSQIDTYQALFESNSARTKQEKAANSALNNPFWVIERSIALLNQEGRAHSSPHRVLKKADARKRRRSHPTKCSLLRYFGNYQTVKKMRWLLYKNVITTYLNTNKAPKLKIKMLQLLATHFSKKIDPNAYKQQPAYQQLVEHRFYIKNKEKKIPKAICKEIVAYLLDPFEVERITKELRLKHDRLFKETVCFNSAPLPKEPPIFCEQSEIKGLVFSQRSSEKTALIQQTHRVFLRNILQVDLFCQLYSTVYLEKNISNTVYGVLFLIYPIKYALACHLNRLFFSWSNLFGEQPSAEVVFALPALLAGKIGALFTNTLFFNNLPTICTQFSVDRCFKLAQVVYLVSGLLVCRFYFFVANWWRIEMRSEKEFQSTLLFTALGLGEAALDYCLLSYTPCYLASCSLLSKLLWASYGAAWAITTFFVVESLI